MAVYRGFTRFTHKKMVVFHSYVNVYQGNHYSPQDLYVFSTCPRDIPPFLGPSGMAKTMAKAVRLSLWP